MARFPVTGPGYECCMPGHVTDPAPPAGITRSVLPDPRPREHDVLTEVAACVINRGERAAVPSRRFAVRIARSPASQSGRSAWPRSRRRPHGRRDRSAMARESQAVRGTTGKRPCYRAYAGVRLITAAGAAGPPNLPCNPLSWMILVTGAETATSRSVPPSSSACCRTATSERTPAQSMNRTPDISRTSRGPWLRIVRSRMCRSCPAVRRSISPLTPTIVSRPCGRTHNAKPMITPWSAVYSHVRDSYVHRNAHIPESGSPVGSQPRAATICASYIR